MAIKIDSINVVCFLVSAVILVALVPARIACLEGSRHRSVQVEAGTELEPGVVMFGGVWGGAGCGEVVCSVLGDSHPHANGPGACRICSGSSVTLPRDGVVVAGPGGGDWNR